MEIFLSSNKLKKRTKVKSSHMFHFDAQILFLNEWDEMYF